MKYYKKIREIFKNSKILFTIQGWRRFGIVVAKNLLTLLTILIMLLQPLAFASDDFAALDAPASRINTPLFEDIPSVYSASKYEQKVTKAPASISIVTGDEIKKYGYRTFGQILNSLRGFYNTTDRTYGYAGARGFGLPSDYNSRLLLLIDGHRYNDVMFDAFDTSEGFPVDTDIIERVEVVRGPSSSLYGTSAVFGVINVITKRGRDQHGANIKYSYGTNDTHKTSASYGNRFKNGLEAFVTGTWYDSQGYDKLFYKEFDTPATNNGLSVGNDGERDRKLMGKASFGDFSFQGLHLNRHKDIPTASFGGIFNNHSQTFADQATFFELKYDHTFENQLNVQSRLSYNNYRFKGYLPTIGSSFTSLVDSEWWRYEIEASRLMWEDHHITFGGQYQDNFRQYQTFFDSQGNTLSNKNVQTYQWALFVLDDYAITDQISLNAGLRFDYYSIFGSTINPRAGLIYSPWQSTTFKLLYGQAFRAPNQNELNNNIPGAVVANPNLQPEKLDTLEFIIEHYFNRQLRAEFNVFHTNIKDNITLTATNNGLAKNQNNRDVESIGFETQIENTWGDGFQGRLSYSWQNTTDKKTGERLTNSPEHMVKLNLIAPLWRDKVFVGFETQFMSSRKTPSKPANGNLSGRVGDYVISNLTVYTQNWVKGLELSAGVYNLFDQRYFDPASADHTQNAIQQDGLQFRVKGSMDF
jgi:outer membrane receptor for ferrienterochelin and colicins